jgi:hypothetical protein
VTVAFAAICACGIAAVLLLVVNRSGSSAVDDPTEDALVGPNVPSDDAVDPPPSVEVAPAPSVTDPTTAPTAPVTPSGPRAVTPIAVSPSSTLSGQAMPCTNETVSFSAANLFDGTLERAWAPVSDDGRGERVVMTLGRPEQLSSVGLIPGYARIEPDSDQGCASTDRFERNRIIRRVRWEFSDGSAYEQEFSPTRKMQSVSIDEVTSTVTLVILETSVPAGSDVDDDTLISEVSLQAR